MWIRVDWVGLRCILTYYGFKPTRYHPIHMDTHQNEQALRWILTYYGFKPVQYHCNPHGLMMKPTSLIWLFSFHMDWRGIKMDFDLIWI
jgi:hypothetical protein